MAQPVAQDIVISYQHIKALVREVFNTSATHSGFVNDVSDIHRWTQTWQHSQ